MEHLKHHFKKVGNLEVCQCCNMTVENYYGIPNYTRNGVNYFNYLPNCISIEELNKVFENLEF
jgi:hypothetical protein